MAHIGIFGGCGFIGTNFVYHYGENHPDDKITVVDKLTYAGRYENIAKLVLARLVEFEKIDIAKESDVNELFERKKFDIVVNFAAETCVDKSILQPTIFVKTNVLGTQHLLAASLANKVKRFHQVSTDEVYGDLGFGSTTSFTESTTLNPNCPYAASKAAADMLVQSYFRTYGLPATISRCSNNYGPFQFPEKLIPKLFMLAQRDEPLPIMGTGLNVRDWLYVTDHCRGIDAILRNGTPGEIYNIGGHNERTNLEIAKKILAFLKKPESLITFVPDRLAHDERYSMNPAKIEAELGWMPETDLETGLQKTFEWYAGLTPEGGI